MFLINTLGLSVTKIGESLRLLAYDDKQPSKTITSPAQVKGTLTIGYGHTKTAKVGQKITPSKAEILLKQDMADAVLSVNKLVKVPITQNMFNAMADFCFNVGEPTFKKSSVLTLTNQKRYAEASNAFFNFLVPVTIKSRRQKEHDMYLLGYGKLPMELPEKKNNKNPALFYQLVKLGFAFSFFG